MQAALGVFVLVVCFCLCLTESQACLVREEHDMGESPRRMLKSAGHEVPDIKPILEINGGHPLVERLHDEQNEQRFIDWSHILFDQAALAEGTQLEDPTNNNTHHNQQKKHLPK